MQRFKHGSYRLEQQPACRDHLIALRLEGTCAAERIIGGRHVSAVTRPGSITIVPAGLESAWDVQGAGELFYIFLAEELLGQVMKEEGRATLAANVVDRIGIVDPHIQRVASEIASELDGGATGSTLFLEALVVQLATYVARRHTGVGVTAGFGRDHRPFERAVATLVVDYVDARLGEPITIADLAGLVGAKRSAFCHRFKATFGVPPHHYVLRQRVERAKSLLLKTRSKPIEIAVATGFSDQSHLIAAFKKVTGFTPSTYRSQRSLNLAGELRADDTLI